MPGKGFTGGMLNWCVARGITHPIVIALVGIRRVRVNGREAAVQNVPVPQEPVGDISIELIPLLDSPSLFEMIVVDMIKPLVPSLEALLVQLDNLLTEPTPKSRLPISPDLMSLELLTDIIFVVDFMPILEMRLKLFSPVKHFGTLFNLIGTIFMTSPCFDLVMLRILVSFPVTLAAKGLETSFKRAAVRTSMTFLMLSVTPLADRNTVRKEHYTSDRIPAAFFSGKIHKLRSCASS